MNLGINKYLNVKNKKLKALSSAGWPDRMFLIKGGKPLFIEFKTLQGILSPLQEVTIDELIELEYNVKVCRDVSSTIREVSVTPYGLQQLMLSKVGIEMKHYYKDER